MICGGIMTNKEGGVVICMCVLIPHMGRYLMVLIFVN